VVVSDIRNPFYTDVLRGLEDAARGAGYSLVIGNGDERLDKEAAYLDLFVAERLAGVVISAASQEHTDVAAVLNQGIPVVAIDRELHRQAVDTVLVDNEAGAYQATRHLLGQGYGRIACITGPSDRTTAVDRLAGYRRACTEVGLDVDESMVRHADFRQTGGYASAYELLTSTRPPDAIFATNNLMTIGVLEAAAQLGLRPPDDIGIVGFDDIPLASLLAVPPSVVVQPAYEIGAAAAAQLLRRCQGEVGPPHRLVLPVEFRARATSLRRSPAA
jgi:LacI family transcriptional regulator